MDHARERVINHLAHELSTPISLLKSVVNRFAKALKKYERNKAQTIQKIGNRNIQRLMDLQTKAIDIIKYGSVADKEFIEDLIIRASEVVSDVIQDTKGEDDKYLKKILERIESIYKIGEIQIETIDITDFIEHVAVEINEIDHHRDIKIETDVTPGLTLDMDKNVLRRVLLGIIKNAIENTPDEGHIKISAYVDQAEIVIDCIDHGIGIPPESRDQIFGGFYHIQTTPKYATKKPFKFNAGGAGIDLLRAKVLSERLHFHIEFHSKRCDHMLLGNYQCTGRISTCPYIEQKNQCYYSGGSTFSIKFQKNHHPANF
jgi:signal transduction histidine kinase